MMSVLEVEGPKGAVIVGEAGAGVGADVGGFCWDNVCFPFGLVIILDCLDLLL